MTAKPEHLELPAIGEAPFSEWGEARAGLLNSCEKRFQTLEVESEHLAMARAVCAELLRWFWMRRTTGNLRWLRPWKGSTDCVSREILRLARKAGEALGEAPLVEACFLASSVYTKLLPQEMRSKLGAFYTPPALVDRLLDILAAEGVVWAAVSVLDPACGGGAFLAPVASRMLSDRRVQALAPEAQLRHLEEHLAGIELDPFSAWMTETFLRILTHPLSIKAGRPVQIGVEVKDALEAVQLDRRRFGLILGNPPYGRVSLKAEQRNFFNRSLFGHANTYTLFLDAALRWRDAEGLIGFVTPTSFLGGHYFSKLRGLLDSEAPPLTIDIVGSRTGVFEAVQQETCLAVFGQNPEARTAVHLLEIGESSVRVTRAGVFRPATKTGEPWFLPRTPEQAHLARRASRLETRLASLGYRACTGPLVWNRLKGQLRARASRRTYPLIWAEAVRANRFSFSYLVRARSPFFHIEPNQGHLVTSERCVLIQRTTAKEQSRRLIACAMPEAFLRTWQGIVVENHVNLLVAVGEPLASPEAVAAILNTKAADLAFRCLSGSVAVSATELHALPLPGQEIFKEVEKLLRTGVVPGVYEEIESLVAHEYGIAG